MIERIGPHRLKITDRELVKAVPSLERALFTDQISMADGRMRCNSLIGRVRAFLGRIHVLPTLEEAVSFRIAASDSVDEKMKMFTRTSAIYFKENKKWKVGFGDFCSPQPPCFGKYGVKVDDWNFVEWKEEDLRKRKPYESERMCWEFPEDRKDILEAIRFLSRQKRVADVPLKGRLRYSPQLRKGRSAYAEDPVVKAMLGTELASFYAKKLCLLGKEFGRHYTAEGAILISPASLDSHFQDKALVCPVTLEGLWDSMSDYKGYINASGLHYELPYISFEREIGYKGLHGVRYEPKENEK